MNALTGQGAPAGSTEVEYPRSLSTPIQPRPVAPDISVVIPTLGRPILETCLRYIADGTHWPAALYVCDQGRVPAAAGMMERLRAAGLNAIYIPSHEKGRSAGINRGLERVETTFVAITDDDCFVRSDWLLRMVEGLRGDPGTIRTGRVEMAGAETAFSVVLSREPRRYTRPLFRVHPFIGGNAGMSMDIVQRVGYFDEHPCVASAEDSDYGHRALRLGIPIAYDPDVVLHHYHWRDEAQRAERYADYARSQGGFYGKHLRRGDRLIMLQTVHALVRSPIRWIRGILRRDPEMIRNGRESTLNLLPGIAAGFRRARNWNAGTDGQSGAVGRGVGESP